jgi:hypothetical protein
VSWNGATAVDRWQLLAGPDPEHLEPIADVAATDFEVTLRARTKQPTIAARAIDVHATILATSTPVRTR